MRKPINNILRPFLIWGKFAYSNNMVGIVEFTGRIEEEDFKQALEIIQKRHPFLATRIEDSSDTYFTCENVSEIPLKIIPREHENLWREIVVDELHKPFELYVGPLVRVVYIAGQDRGEIVWVFDHIISDGISRVKLCIELFEIVHALKKQEHISCEPDNSWAADACSALSKYSHDELQALQDFQGWASMHGSFSEFEPPAQNRKTHFIPYDFSPEETAYIQENYKKHDASLQGILSAAMAQVIAENVRAKTGEKTPTVICHHPVNLRPHLNPSLTSSDVGAWVGVVNNEIPIDPDRNVWDLACSIKKTLYASLEKNHHFAYVARSSIGVDRERSEKSDYDFFVNAQVRRPFSVVSQMGVIQVADTYGDLRIESMRGLYNWTVFLNHQDTFVLSGHILRDRFIATFAYVTPYVSHEQARMMANKVIQKLTKN